MEARSGRKKPTIELRYYELPEHEPTLALLGQEWLRRYGDRPEDLHFHNLMEIGLCQWGEGSMYINGSEYPYQGGTVSLIPAYCPHTTISKSASLNQWEYLFVDPRQLLQKAFPNDQLFVESIVQRLASGAKLLHTGGGIGEGQALAALLRLILEEYRSRQPYHSDVVQNLLVSLLLMGARWLEQGALAAHAERPAHIGLRQIMPATEYINRAYMNPISTREIAAQCSMSEAQLRRKFREYLNKSPNEYLTTVRINRGLKLIQTTDYSMPEVALRVGYQSVSSFDRNFQKIVGMSPYQFKKNGKEYKARPAGYHVLVKEGWKTKDDP